MEGNVRLVRSDLTLERVSYGLGAAQIVYLPTSVKTWTSANAFNDRANMFDGDLTTTVSFSTTASIRQMLCFPVPVNSIYAFLSSAAAGTGMHIVVETPTVA